MHNSRRTYSVLSHFELIFFNWQIFFLIFEGKWKQTCKGVGGGRLGDGTTPQCGCLMGEEKEVGGL